MRVYIAAPWVRREVAIEAAEVVKAAGHVITHDWWNHEAGDEDHERLQVLARLDFEAVQDCDALILLNIEKSEGKAVEQGIALASGIPFLIGVGNRYTNIFQHLSKWHWVDTVEQAVALLKL